MLEALNNYHYPCIRLWNDICNECVYFTVKYQRVGHEMMVPVECICEASPSMGSSTRLNTPKTLIPIFPDILYNFFVST